ncbi:MAG: hypothetical protein ACD_60C00157G0008 [uncultured bacterium]|nr:MAG: hypothetical protein ACD_60C00157G0008 [uncultured bacterium]
MKLLTESCCDEKTLDESFQKSFTVALVGNPNCGKTTVFNRLTGARQRVGNWPGVTVERKTGLLTYQDKKIQVMDLPGTYSLNVVNESSSVDERIACEYILAKNADLIINILDASNLERHLYLTMQLLEMRVPMLIALNMMDVANERGIKIKLKQLAKELNCVIVPIEAHKNKGIEVLKQKMVEHQKNASHFSINYLKEDILKKAISEISSLIKTEYSSHQKEWIATRLLEDDVFVRQKVDSVILKDVLKWQQTIRDTLQEDPDILLADARYRFIEKLRSKTVIKNKNSKTTWTTYIDNIVLNRILGIPIFLMVMYAMFFFAINIGGAFQDFFDIGSNTLFVDGASYGLAHLGAPSWLIVLLANGLGKGINTTVTFIPVIGAMFLFLALLEDSGYMARAAFIMDRLMRAMGLPGKSFVPMIVGFGCNVPAVMAARTLENKRDRILTVMMSPFMSCSARLAIYAVFTAAFFPVGGQNIVFLLYLIGIAMAMLTGLMLRKTLLQGEPAPLVMELPSYHLPNIKTVLLHAWQRLKGFLFRAGKLILPICILIGACSAWNMNGSIVLNADGDANSVLSMVGRMVTPIFAPMGIHQDNWPATVGLVTGILAKEVVIGTLNALYSQMGHLGVLQANAFHFFGGLQQAVLSIPANLAQLGNSFSNPVLAIAPVHVLAQGVYGLMYQRFDGQVGAIAYLLFVLLYFPCVSTIAAMWREVHRGWAIFSVFWTTGIAYGVSVGFYQLATYAKHPLSSFYWVAGIVMALCLTITGVKIFAESSIKYPWGRYEFSRN